MSHATPSEIVGLIPEPLPAGPTQRLLSELVRLCCPANLVRQIANGGLSHAAWDVPYRRADGAPKWAWAVLNQPVEGSKEPGSLRVEAREFSLVFSGDGELIRVRDGDHYLSPSERYAFYANLRLGDCPPATVPR